MTCGFVCVEVQQILLALVPLLLCVYVCRLLANVKDSSSVQLRPIKDTCVYLWGWGPCPPHRKVHSSELFPAVWCQNYTHRPSEFLGEGGGRILTAQEPSKASLQKTYAMRWANKWPWIQTIINKSTYLHKARVSHHFHRMTGSWPSHNLWFSTQIGCPRRNWMTWDSHGNRCSCCEDSSFPGAEEGNDIFSHRTLKTHPVLNNMESMCF